ncbi:MAG: hypothetical protein EOL98_16060, partial [Negativicutes bacterium]|nr:hypothetical protein [Negativicutes bacterium]
MSRLKSRWFKKSVVYTLVILSAFVLALTIYKNRMFSTTGLDGLLFYITNGLEGANTKTFSVGVVENIVPFLILLVILLIPVVDVYKNKIVIHMNLKLRKVREFQLNPSVIINKYMLRYAIALFVLSLGFALYSVDIYHYVLFKSSSSSFIAENYVDPSKVNLTFPENKRNLVYIYLESVENTIASRAVGGSADESMIPELESMALDQTNVSFSNTDALGGMLPVHGTTWTVGAMVAQSSG